MAPRLLTALGAVALVALGVVFMRVLVANTSDNAYLWLALIGLLLFLPAAPFALATLLPERAGRRLVVRIGLWLLIGVAVLAGVLLIFSLAIIPSQGYDYDPRVFRNHLIGFVVLAVTLPVLYVVLNQAAR